MKELSIEEKARRYESALEKCRKLYKEAKANEYTSDIEDYETIFPELKESEDDESTRKRIIALVNAHGQGRFKESMLVWLEKQGENSSNKMPIWKHWKDGIAGNGEGKPIYLIKDGGAYRISSVLCSECDYIKLSELDNLMLEKQKLTECIKFNNEFENQVSNLLASVLNGEHEYNESFVKYAAQSLLGYAKNELKPIEWSEEDDVMVHDILGLLPVKTRPEYNQRREDWLKSLKSRVQPKHEWSEEDIQTLDRIISNYQYFCMELSLKEKLTDVERTVIRNVNKEDIDWLESFRPQPHWKPSQEQMYMLEWLTTNVLDGGVVGNKAKEVLYTLIEQLKSL